MWNFGFYSDNIQVEMIKSVPGIIVGGQVVRDVVYADDDTPVNPNPIQTNLALAAIASQGRGLIIVTSLSHQNAK